MLNTICLFILALVICILLILLQKKKNIMGGNKVYMHYEYVYENEHNDVARIYDYTTIGEIDNFEKIGFDIWKLSNKDNEYLITSIDKPILHKDNYLVKINVKPKDGFINDKLTFMSKHKWLILALAAVAAVASAAFLRRRRAEAEAAAYFAALSPHPDAPGGAEALGVAAAAAAAPGEPAAAAAAAARRDVAQLAEVRAAAARRRAAARAEEEAAAAVANMPAARMLRLGTEEDTERRHLSQHPEWFLKGIRDRRSRELADVRRSPPDDIRDALIQRFTQLSNEEIRSNGPPLSRYGDDFEYSHLVRDWENWTRQDIAQFLRDGMPANFQINTGVQALEEYRRTTGDPDLLPAVVRNSIAYNARLHAYGQARSGLMRRIRESPDVLLGKG